LNNFRVSKVGPESDTILRNLFEHYVHDMSQWFDIDTQPDGSFSYDVASIWANGYHAYLAKVEDALAGFAITGPADDSLCEIPANDVHEFFILRRFRRSGLGRHMAALLWDQNPGEWLVRALEKNAPAVEFWRAAISSYSGGSYKEEARIASGRTWRFFRFASPSAKL
jgi:predicted acetyltransferase